MRERLKMKKHYVLVSLVFYILRNTDQLTSAIMDHYRHLYDYHRVDFGPSNVLIMNLVNIINVTLFYFINYIILHIVWRIILCKQHITLLTKI